MQKKPFRVAAICLLCLLLPAMPIVAEEEDGYLFIWEDSMANSYFLYLPSVETREHYSGDYVVGWIRVDYSDEGAAKNTVNGVKVHENMMFCAANPKARQVQIISVTYYDSDGEVIGSAQDSFNSFAWKECTPGTTGERIWEVLMKIAGYR